MKKKISYAYIDSRNYTRIYVTNARINSNPNQDVVIDFCEEYLDPILVKEYEISDKETITHYSHSEEELRVINERKCTVIMSTQQALKLARYIIDNYSKEEDDEDN